MKKKITAIMLCLAMLAIAIAGGSLAYFTDTDAQSNVMTTGKVDISQNEQQRAPDGSLVDFAQDKPLMPMVSNIPQGEGPVVNGYFHPKMNNVVDKIITVKNEAAEGAVNQDAYVRTILAFETATEYEENTATVRRDGKEIFTTYIGVLMHPDFQWLTRNTIMINGTEYVLGVMVYPDPLTPQQVTEPSLKQLFLSPDADNEVSLLFGTEYTVLALSQGTQTAGFTNAESALNAAFGILDGDGAVDDATLAGWFSSAAKE